MTLYTNDRFSRSEMLLGHEAMDKLSRARVAVFGIGGVGGHAAEALARGGVGTIYLVDSDKVEKTNINRQLVALESTLGMYKTEVMARRLIDINPDICVYPINKFFDLETVGDFDFSDYDYIIDAIDSIASKILLIERAKSHEVPIVSSMGMGNKLDPTSLFVTDIKDTSVCPLAKIVRRELKLRKIEDLKVVYSREQPIKPQDGVRIPGSVSFVPPVAGLILAGEVIKDLSIY